MTDATIKMTNALGAFLKRTLGVEQAQQSQRATAAIRRSRQQLEQCHEQAVRDECQSCNDRCDASGHDTEH